MTTQPEFLIFKDHDAAGRKTRIVGVYSARSDKLLGVIAWFNRWRQYTFSPEPETTFNVGSLETISLQIAAMMRDRKARA